MERPSENLKFRRHVVNAVVWLLIDVVNDIGIVDVHVVRREYVADRCRPCIGRCRQQHGNVNVNIDIDIDLIDVSLSYTLLAE